MPERKLRAGLSWTDPIYFPVGVDTLAHGIIDRRPTRFVGPGFHFADNESKRVLGSLPAGALQRRGAALCPAGAG